MNTIIAARMKGGDDIENIELEDSLWTKGQESF